MVVAVKSDRLVARFIKLIVFVGFSGILWSCLPHEPEEKNDIILQVSIANTKGLDWVYLLEVNIKDLKKIDSFNVKKTGRHGFRMNPGEPGFYLLQTKPGGVITLLLTPGERAELFADARKMEKSYEIKGSPGSSLLRDYFYKTQVNLDKVDSLKKLFGKFRYAENYAEKRKELDSSYHQVFTDQRKLVIDFVNRNCQSISSIFVINQLLGPNQILNTRDDFKYFVMVDSCLITKYPKNKHVLDNHERVSKVLRKQAEQELAAKRLAPGQQAPEITLADQTGKEITLSSLRGKPVLVYFWKATSAPARQDHKLLKDFYQTNKAKGIEILSVSMDTNPELWKAALKIDHLPWLTVRDPKGESSPTGILYAVDNKLPIYVLVDHQGKIVIRGRKFSEIKEKIGQALSQ